MAASGGARRQGELRDGRSERHALGLRDRGLGPDSCTVWQNAVQGRHSPHASDRVALKTSQAGRAWAGSGTVRRGRPSGPAQAAGRSPGAGGRCSQGVVPAGTGSRRPGPASHRHRPSEGVLLLSNSTLCSMFFEVFWSKPLSTWDLSSPTRE